MKQVANVQTQLPKRLKGKTVKQLREIARQDVAEFEREYGPFEYPFDAVKLARRAGAQVFRTQLGEGIDGMIESTPRGADIHYDEEAPLTRRRFTIAHELGHMISYKEEETMADFVDWRDDDGRGNAAEVYANEFAGNLLIPADLLRSLIAEGLDNLQIANILKVSMQAVGYRRQILGI